MTSASPGSQALRPDQFTAQAFDTAGMTARQLVMPYRRRTSYKISLYTGGTAQLIHAGQTLAVRAATLVFYNPLLTYCCQRQVQLTGWCCEFTEEFLYGVDRSASLQESPLFCLGTNPVFALPPEQVAFLEQLFQQMAQQAGSDYRHRQELLRTCVQLVVQTALQLRLPPAPAPAPAARAANRIATQFLQLLEGQFPVASPACPLPRHTAQAFATHLGLHVNHLNRAVRAATGKTTSAHLAGRLVLEAQVLLQHTDWSIADVAQGLGFGDATHFNHFFRKQTGQAPKAFRHQLLGRTAEEVSRPRNGAMRPVPVAQ